MTTPPLSAAAQAVLDAVVDGALPPFHVIARPMAAAAIRALVEQVARRDRTGMPYITPADIIAIAAELYGGAGQHTNQPTETPDEHA
jgi:hypothetical protein